MKTFLIGLVVVAVLAVVTLVNTSGFVVKAGNVGLVINHYTGKVDPRVRHAGFNAQPPFSGNELLEIPTYERTYTMVRESSEGAHTGDDSVLVNTLSSNTLNVDASVTYHIAYDPQHPEQLIALYQKYRNQFANFSAFEEAQLRPAFRQAVVDAFGLAATSQNMTGAGKRQAAAYALKELNARFNPDSIVVDEVRIRAIYPDEATVTALRSRLQAQQNLKLAQLNLQLQQLTNQKAVLAAQAGAQAAHIRAASLTPRLVRFKHIKDIEIVGVPRGAIINVPSGTPAAASDAQAATPDNSRSGAGQAGNASSGQ
ncbi:MAG: SPFH domain-containing protein [Armatimonadetes bacterium]|nr:SPFH domain-containing protein [Armatimonadota bacterium]